MLSPRTILVTVNLLGILGDTIVLYFILGFVLLDIQLFFLKNHRIYGVK